MSSDGLAGVMVRCIMSRELSRPNDIVYGCVKANNNSEQHFRKRIKNTEDYFKKRVELHFRYLTTREENLCPRMIMIQNILLERLQSFWKYKL